MPKVPQSRIEVQRLASQVVQVARRDGMLSVFMATNPGWSPITEDADGGMDRNDSRLDLAEEALIRRYWQELAGPRLTLQQWVNRESAKRGGSLPRLAADLLGLPTIPRRVRSLPERQQSAQYLAYRNELRKLEEYRQGKYQRAAGLRQSRIATLPGGENGNPYAPAAVIAGSRLPNYELKFAIRGDWHISQTYRFTLKSAPDKWARYRSLLHGVVFSGGVDFIDTMVDTFAGEISHSHDEKQTRYYTGQDVALLHVYSLALQSRLVR